MRVLKKIVAQQRGLLAPALDGPSLLKGGGSSESLSIGDPDVKDQD